MLDEADQMALVQIKAADNVVDALPSRPGWMLDALCRKRPEVEFVPVETRSGVGRDSQAEAGEVWWELPAAA